MYKEGSYTTMNRSKYLTVIFVSDFHDKFTWYMQVNLHVHASGQITFYFFLLFSLFCHVTDNINNPPLSNVSISNWLPFTLYHRMYNLSVYGDNQQHKNYRRYPVVFILFIIFWSLTSLMKIMMMII